MPSPYVRQQVKTWASRNKITPHNLIKLISAVLEHGPQLQWKSYWRESAKALEHQGRVKGFETSQDQICGESHHADVDTQATYNEHTLSPCHTATFNA